MKHFVNLKDINAKDLRKILIDAKKRKIQRKSLSVLEVDKDLPLKGKLLIQMFEKSSLRTRLSFYLAIKQLGGSTLTLRPDELHLSKGGESIEDTAKILSNFGNAFMFRTDNDKIWFPTYFFNKLSYHWPNTQRWNLLYWYKKRQENKFEETY